MRISDWSSDVCSSDLQRHAVFFELDDDQVQSDVGDLLRLDAEDPANAVGRINNVITFTVFALCHARLSPIGWGSVANPLTVSAPDRRFSSACSGSLS